MRANSNILDLIGRDVELERVASTHGGEYAGPCPLCGGRDRFRVWPVLGRCWCRVCDWSGDGIAYRVERGELTPTEAGRLRRSADGSQVAQGEARRPVAAPYHAEPLAPPGPDWQRCARAFCEYASAQLWETPEALDYLRGRGLSDDTIRRAGLGWNAREWRRDPAKWGLKRTREIWLPVGLVIPWVIGGSLWRVNIRQPEREPKYIGPAGFVNALYGADGLAVRQPAIVVEGELDALTIRQAAGDLVAPVATGSTGGARRAPWVARLAVCSVVLLAFDVDDAGEKAASWWLGVLDNARRWRPTWEDATAMAEAGADVRAWILAGLGGAAFALLGEGGDVAGVAATSGGLADASGSGAAAALGDLADDLVGDLGGASALLGDRGDVAGVAAALGGDVGPEAEALALLERMATDPDARRRYAEIAERQDWPCFGTSWAEWAEADA